MDAKRGDRSTKRCSGIMSMIMPKCREDNEPHINAPPQPNREDKNQHRRRQKRLRKLEKAEEEQRRNTRILEVQSSQRIYSIPPKTRPVSLFVRMGSVQDEDSDIPLEYLSLGYSEEEEEESRRDTTESISTSKSPNGSPRIRPSSISIPAKIIAKDEKGRRPRSLRILDPQDNKIYNLSRAA